MDKVWECVGVDAQCTENKHIRGEPLVGCIPHPLLLTWTLWERILVVTCSSLMGSSTSSRLPIDIDTAAAAASCFIGGSGAGRAGGALGAAVTGSDVTTVVCKAGKWAATGWASTSSSFLVEGPEVLALCTIRKTAETSVIADGWGQEMIHTLTQA